MKGSDNPAPSLLIVEGAAPASPAAGDQRLFIDSADHLLKRKNSGGAVTAIGSAYSLEVKEADGAPDVTGVTQLILPNGTLTDNTGGSVTYTPAGGGGGSDLVQVASGMGSVVIPGLKGSPDRVPTSPGAQDDEFTALAGWTSLSTLDTSNVTDFPSNWHAVKNSPASQTLYGIYKTAPSMPFTVTAKINGCILSGNQSLVGILLTDATPTKLAHFGPMYNSGASGNKTEYFWSYYNSNGSRAGYVEYFDNAPYLPALTAEILPHYIRMVVTNSTTIAVAISMNGYLWTTLGTALNPAFTVANVGLAVGNGAQVEAIFDWIRFT